jgi:hypothetical protein
VLIIFQNIKEVRVTNNFPDGIFRFVNKVSLFDERRFEHEFFLRIDQHMFIIPCSCLYDL